jgi:Outer membrane protein beta-barrel family/Carboxypeptidase regulatory-like domain
MFKKLCVSIVLFCITQFVIAQSSSITGIIKDTTADKLVKNAVVAVLSQSDSTLIRFARTKEDGSYALPSVPAGKYIFMVMHPNFADYVEDIVIQSGNEKMAMVAVTPKSKLLEAVIIKSGNPIRIKGDTTIYTADSFKVSANANVEELLKKMPGIQVDKNGQIKAMGETVEKVLVDGEEFFGDDPGMAVKNLRADAVKEVQVFKKKTDQAEFTGIDDGLSKQTINLKLKEDKKTGYFGKINLSGGLQNNIDDRYNTNLMYSSFKGKRKLSGFLLNGNTGQDGLSWQDMEKYGGNEMNFEMSDDGGMMFFSNGGGGSDEEPYVNTQNGFITNVNAGLQYNNKFKDKNTLNISPKFNSQVYDNNNINFVQTLLGDSTLNENATAQTHVNRNNFKANASYDMKLDTNNTLKITFNANVYHTESDEQRTSATTGEFGNLKNTNERSSQLTSDKQSFAGSALFKHKFKKNRRTLSVNADFKTLDTEAGNFIEQNFRAYEPGGINGQINQFTAIDKATNSISSKIVYTEPLSKKFSLELGHEVSVNNGKNNQTTFEFTPATGKFDARVDSLSNNFNQTIITNKPSAKISFAGKKIKYNFGTGIGFTNFDLEDVTFNKAYVRNFINFFPQALFTYNYKSNSSIRFNYNGRTTQPTFNQLQPLRNNNDLFNQYVGNPNLKQSFNNSFNISNNAYNFLKESWKYISINASFTSNAITNNRDINPATGYTVIKPINTDGNMSIGMWSGLGLKLKKADLRIGFNPSLNYNRFADVINSVTNYTKNLNAGASFNVSKSKDKKYDVTISNEYNYNRNKNSLNFNGGKASNVSFFSTNTFTTEATVYYKKVWSVNSTYNFYYRQKTSAFTEDLNNHLLNAKLQRTFKKNEFTAYLQVRDILNQNIGVERNFNGVTYREERNDRLQRYWLVGFTWDFKNKAPKAKEEPAK